jgi:hypothetical protein
VLGAVGAEHERALAERAVAHEMCRQVDPRQMMLGVRQRDKRVDPLRRHAAQHTLDPIGPIHAKFLPMRAQV